MSQRRKNPRANHRGSLAALALLLVIGPTVSVAQDRSFSYDSREAAVAEQLPTETARATHSRVPPFETGSVVSAVLCFAIGFGACLLLVHHLLPSLVHSQCVEIVHEYLSFVRRESDIRIVVLERESHEPLQKPRRANAPVVEPTAKSSYELQHHLRVDRPAAPAGPSDSHSDNAANPMLSQIYEQNLHLRDQLRKQSQSVKQ